MSDICSMLEKTVDRKAFMRCSNTEYGLVTESHCQDRLKEETGEEIRAV